MVFRSLTVRLSRTLSWVLHPLVIPTLAVILLLFGHTVMSGILLQSKWFFAAMVALSTLVIPAFLIALLRTLHILPENSNANAHPLLRLIPLLIVAASYVVCAFMLGNLPTAFLIRRFLFVALGCILLAGAVSSFWKISLHMIAMGGLLAILLLINFSGYGQFFYTFLAFLMLAGLLGSVRLYLGGENIWQTGVGFLGGFLVSALVILFS